MILEHAPFGRRGFYASFTLQGVQAGQIMAAAVFLPLAHYMPTEAFNSWGWRIPFLLSFIVIVAGYIIRREVDETPAFAEEGEHGAVPKAPIFQAITESWRDMLRVMCCSLMNVIPVVTTIFGAAYAVQPGYGIGFAKDVMWGVVYQGYNAVFPSFYPEMFPTRTRVSGMAISQNLGTVVTALLPVLFVTVAPPGATNIPMTIGAITLGVTIIAAISAWTARETCRVHLNDLGNADAVPVPKHEYDRLREQTMGGAQTINVNARTSH
jgi:MFS family permease